jgi:hypothetical protein
MDKIAIFYMIGQYGDQWKEKFYHPQMNLIKESGLWDHIQFIDIFVKGNEIIDNVTTKCNNITYMGELEEERPTNKKLYRAYNFIQHRMWSFSKANPDYKVLFFHSLGVSHQNSEYFNNKLKWREYMETLLIKNWKKSVELLDFYDCVGTEYIPYATYSNETIQFYAPHYQGFFWWANTSYLSKLDPTYFYKNVEWQPFLCELWIGSGNPKAYNYYNSWLNHYIHEINPPYKEILDKTDKHLIELKNEL